VALHVVDQEGKKEKAAAAADERDRVPLRKIVDAIQHCMEQKQYSQVTTPHDTRHTMFSDRTRMSHMRTRRVYWRSCCSS
jgi:hypothetical protein